jgi:hypothetical protein
MSEAPVICPRCGGPGQQRASRHYECGPCRAELAREWRSGRVEHRRSYELARLSNKIAWAQESRRLNPTRVLARNKVYRALKAGRLVRGVCACGNPQTEAHHTDYSRALDVMWLCRECHTKEHLVYNIGRAVREARPW